MNSTGLDYVKPLLLRICSTHIRFNRTLRLCLMVRIPWILMAVPSFISRWFNHHLELHVEPELFRSSSAINLFPLCSWGGSRKLKLPSPLNPPFTSGLKSWVVRGLAIRAPLAKPRGWWWVKPKAYTISPCAIGHQESIWNGSPGPCALQGGYLLPYWIYRVALA